TGDFDTEFEANGDYDYVLRALEHGGVRGGDFIASRYRRHRASITGRQEAQAVKSRLALERLFERRPDLYDSQVGRDARAHLKLGAARRMMHAGRFRASARQLASAVRLSPRFAVPP